MREVRYVAIIEGTVFENLKALGISSRVCVNLRKKMGLIRLNNESVTIVEKIHVGDEFSIMLEDTTIKRIDKYEFPVKIVYEDDDLAIVDKPSGIAVINTRNHYGKSLENALAAKWGDFVYRPVNRLDRDTSGLMIVAKNQLAHSILGESHITRKYLALCEGTMEGDGIITAPIELEEGSTMKRCVSVKGKAAETSYSVLKNYSTYSLVELVLKTGRTHQIRVHMASMGHPLLCDQLYNPNSRKEHTLDDGYILDRQALHSYYIEFNHPISGKKIVKKSNPTFIKIDLSH